MVNLGVPMELALASRYLVNSALHATYFSMFPSCCLVYTTYRYVSDSARKAVRIMSLLQVGVIKISQGQR